MTRTERPPSWFVCRALGQMSETWLWRQLMGMERLAPQAVCWEHQNPSIYPVDSAPVHVLPFDSRPMDRPSRWLIRLRNLPRGNFYGTVGAERRALSRLMQATRPRVVLAQYGYMALRILPVARDHSVPVVAHFHGLDASSMLRDRWYRWSLLRGLPQLAGIVVVGEYQRKWMRQHGVPETKLHLIPCGVPVSEFSPADALRHQPCRFLSVGRFVPKKAPLETLRAFALCARENPDATLRMIGDGRLKEAAEKLASELGIRDRVEFLGAKDNATVRGELREAGAFVQHSVTARDGDMEGWPVSIAEAVASGVPVVSTRHGGISQQIQDGENGYLVAEHDWEAMGKAMAKLAADPALRARLGANGRARALKQFDFKDRIRELEDVLLAVSR